MQSDLYSINRGPLMRLWSTLFFFFFFSRNGTATPPHLLSMSQHAQGFCVKVVLDDNWCRRLTKQYKKGWGNKRRRGCVSPVVCLTILSHALIAQTPSLALAGAPRLRRVVKSTLVSLHWKPNRFFFFFFFLLVGGISQRGTAGMCRVWGW